MGFSEHLHAVGMGLGLVFAGEVQVDIGHLVAAKAQEGLKGDVEAVLFELAAAFWADGIRQVRTAAIALGYIEGGVLALRVRAAIVRREGIHLRNAGHIGNDGGAHRASGAHQVAMLQGVLHQLLGGHINHIIVAGDDVVQLCLHALGDELRGILAVEPVELAINQGLQVLYGVLDFGRKQIVGHRPQGLAHVGNEIGVCDHYLIGLFLP